MPIPKHKRELERLAIKIASKASHASQQPPAASTEAPQPGSEEVQPAPTETRRPLRGIERFARISPESLGGEPPADVEPQE